MLATSSLDTTFVSDRVDPYHAYMDPDFVLPKTGAGGSLDGLRFAVKDIISISGRTCGAGNPTWLKTHAPAEETAPIVARLLTAGASLHGIVHTEELAFSLIGLNAHYGAPINPNWPDYLTGGSSSGSAVAVASEAVDFALGTDTAGSIRVPASNCGLYSMRPSKQSGWTEGVIPLAPMFDVSGWMTRDAQTLSKIGRVLMEDRALATPTRILLNEGAFAALPKQYEHLLGGKMLSKVVDRLGLPVATADACFADNSDIVQAFRVVQAYEAWREHSDWVSRHAGSMSRDVLGRFQFGQAVTQGHYQDAAAVLTKWKTASLAALADAILIQPTVTVPPLKRVSTQTEQVNYRSACLNSTVTASALGCPEVVLPVVCGALPPIGLSILGSPGADLNLLSIIERL